MKRCNSLKLFALLSIVVGQAFAYSSYDCCGPLEPGHWYVMPKVGAAPGIFTNRGFECQVVPFSGVSCPLSCQDVCPTTAGNVACSQILTGPENVFQQNCCKLPKFSDLFSNGVLHVGGEVGYITDCHCLYFVDLIYDRASGSCVCFENKYVKALDGCCPDDCRDCSEPLVSYNRTDDYDNYTAFGAYIGNRHYFDRIWCDRLAIFLGLKVGILHRKQVCVCTTIPEQFQIGSTTVVQFAERTLNNVAICKSNAVSGGVQIGFDYCINDCLAFLIGFEVVASCPFKTNKNVQVAIPEVATSGLDAQNFPNPTNIIWGRTGTFLQFPIWAGLRWEWDFCCDPCNNNNN